MFARTLATAAIALTLAGAAHAAIVPNVYNTGLGVGGVALPAGDGQIDANYTLIAGTIPGVVTGAPAETYFNPAYFAENPGSRWISYDGSPFRGAGTFSVQTTFDLTGYDIGTAVLSGLWGVDNEGEIFLNGVSTGFVLSGTTAANFNQLYAFTLTSGFVAGVNTLSILVNDTGNPAAVRIDGLVVEATLVPEPASWALMIAGFGLVGMSQRLSGRRKAALAA